MLHPFVSRFLEVVKEHRAVLAACLYMDLRDLLLHMAGRPYLAYVRDHVRNGHVNIDDPKVHEPVTLWNRIFW